MNDLEFLNDVRQWPMIGLHNYCCLTRGDYDNREHGYLLSGHPVVHLGIIFNSSSGDPIKTYDSMQQILDDGWRVD